ncbi:glycosyltransferase [Frigidibacter sp. MR17.24]|uniref:glycosyltransferase n=1 Tax=Frigidibacter sp. MR17.24 TaxID=3127345 RepID=UPI003012CCDC
MSDMIPPTPGRETVPYWREDDEIQNFGDFLSAYLLEHLFLRTPRPPQDVRLVGSYLSDFMVRDAQDSHPGAGDGIALVAWGGGLREPGCLSRELLRHVEIRSVRGPLTSRELGLDGVVPLGDPGLLMPALYRPNPAPETTGKILCLPHFNDTRSDAELLAITGADGILSARIAKSFYELERFIDAIYSAEFVLCGSLHGAIMAAAYGKPFGFFDSGMIDLPFKWQDFAASCGFPAAFFTRADEARAFHDTQIAPVLGLPRCWDYLAVAPFPLRSEALLKILRHEIDSRGLSAEAALAEATAAFRGDRQQMSVLLRAMDELVGSMLAANRATAKLHQDDRAALQAQLAAAEATSREVDGKLGRTEAILSETRDHLTQAEARAAGTKAQYAALQRAADEVAQRLYSAYRKPLLPLGKALERSAVKALLALSPMMSKRRREKFRKLVKKRKPATILKDWTARKAALAHQEAALQPPRPSTAESDLHKLQRRPRIFVSDYRLPRPDLSAGEQATFGLIADLCAVGYDVVFLPADMKLVEPYAANLAKLGVEVITRESGYDWGRNYLMSHGHEFDAFYLIRIEVAEQMLATARDRAPTAPILFHAPDLHYLREERAAELSGDPSQTESARHTKQRELAVMRAADHVVVVSPAEVPYLRAEMPAQQISVFPALYSDVVAAPAGYHARDHVFFIGGFKHTPNVDSVIWFADNVWPAVHAEAPEAEFHIIGAEAPPEVIALGERPGIRYVGYVAELEPELAKYRVGVAPLLYGAGIKGKVGAMMGAGMPTVCTTIAAEGMGIVDGIHALVRDDPAEQARAIVTLYRDRGLWDRLAVNGARLVEDSFGDAANRASFLAMLNRARALPQQSFMRYCATAPDQCFPVYDPAQAIDVSIIIPVYNKWELTRDCLVSVATVCRSTGITYEVILADDGSSDETLQAADLFPGLRVVRAPTNLGFLRNCNNAAAQAKGEHLLFLNNDTIVLPGWLEELYRTMVAEPQAGIVGSKLLYPDATIQEAGGALFKNGSGWNLGRSRGRFDRMWTFQREVDYISGASILVRGSFWKSSGGFDELYGNAYCEDSDLAMQARNTGLSVIYVPGSEVVHFEHASYGDQLDSKPKQLQQENGEKFFQKWQVVLEKDHAPVGGDPILSPGRGKTKI